MKLVRKILMFLLVFCLSVVMGMHGLQAADIDLAEDSDWRGTNVIVAGCVRLNGHRLWLDNLAGIESIPGLQV